jgi:hypothetical protein
MDRLRKEDIILCTWDSFAGAGILLAGARILSTGRKILFAVTRIPFAGVKTLLADE